MGTEYSLVENPSLEYLQTLGYEFINESRNIEARDELNHVILKDIFIKSLIKINDIPEETARSVYVELLALNDNEKWIRIMRGDFSKTIPDFPTKKTILLIDFLNMENNTFTVTNQFRVKAELTGIPDMVCFINGIPVVVIEAKTPVSFNDKTGEAFEQMKKYEKIIPRLFYTNMFNIITNGESLLYGSTGSPSAYWGEWKDPWPKKDDDFSSKLEKGLYSLLEPSRLLDILAHFIVFEERDNKVTKKMCRYQQLRAVNKITNRFLEDRTPKDRKGLIWHSTGSGKSLTMVFAALKLKSHLTIHSDRLSSPNLLIVTDRVDLDTQIVKTFEACGLPNPKAVKSVKELRDKIHSDTTGLTLLATIFKFEGSRKPVPNSGNWVIFVDESHRTQEKDLGAYLHKTFPESWFFGFTGTPIKKADKNTYANFSPEGEMYLDKYSIEDAVADGATVPIYFTSRKAEWHINAAEIDILFDQWFADLDDKKRDELKKKELTTATLLNHPGRVELIAMDIWEHFKGFAKKTGYKAQIVTINREAIILYKRALDKLIAKELMSKGQRKGLSKEEAEKIAATYTVPVYSSNQTDENESEDTYVQGIRDDLKQFCFAAEKGARYGNKKWGSDKTESEVKDAFKKKHQAPHILIVCSKLLTGFDAPAESVMYLDNPLREHNLLQAIARTNRVDEDDKPNGLIVDYVGVTENLHKALSSYRAEDVQNVMMNIDDQKSLLKQAHTEVMVFLKKIKRAASNDKKGMEGELNTLLDTLSSLDQWLTFKRKAKTFINTYSALSPDPYVLDFTRDLKWVALIIPVGILRFEKKGSNDLKTYSGKIREMLAQELEVSGIRDVVKLRDIFDPKYWDDFNTTGKSEDELKTSAVRKASELKKTISEKMSENDVQYGPFSERLKEILKRLEDNQVDFAGKLKEMEELSKALKNEGTAYKNTRLNKSAHGVYTILESFKDKKEKSGEKADKKESGSSAKEKGLSGLQQMAARIDELYTSDQTAPKGWHLKEQMRKDLRMEVRSMVFKLDLRDWKTIPQKIEEFALKHYAKV